ncbi:MAG: methyltransferase domain-containing protein [Acidimicrobiales bacterium]|jgi:SAM-dependent methyltransferase
MPSTASEPDEVTAEESDGPGQVPIPIYRFAFSWEGPYGHAVHLVERHARQGVVLDLGCGYAAVGEVLRDAGWEYVGGDRDTDAVADVVSRGLEGHVIDLAMSDGLADKLVELLEGRPVGAVILLDIIEHLPDPSALLGALTELSALLAADGRHAPVLVTSIPNVAHFDLAAKLVGGRWDVTPSGLLDRTHLQMFTERRIDAEFGRFGWQECGRDDVVLEHSDQWFPLDHPFLVEGGLVHDYLQSLRAAADDNMTINQFVRAYRRVPSWSPSDRRSPLPVPEAATARGPAIDYPFLSVLTRSQGTRPSMLAEALTCLAAQTLEDIEVVVLVPGDDPGALQSSEAVVRSFEEGFVARVRVEQVRSDSRSAALNAGLELAHGRYVAFLDEGDLVTGDWAQRFAEGAEGAPGKLVRSVCDVRHVRRPAREEEAMGAVPVTLTKPLAEFGERFDAISHLAVNTTPLSSVALPRSLVTELHLRLDEQLAVGEDWDFLVRAALVVGVEDTGHVTSIHQRWADEAAATTVPSELWESAHAKMLSSLDAAPLLLPPGSATELAFLAGDASLARKHEAQRAELERALNEARVALAEAQETLRFSLRGESAQTESLLLQIEQLQRRARLAEQAREEVLASEFWRVTAPLRALVTLIRGDRRDAGS